MAYTKPFDEEEENTEEGQGSVNTSGVVDSFTSAGQTQGDADANVTAKAPGTGFVNLQTYLDANKSEGGRMVGQTTKGLSKQADGYGKVAQGVVADASKDFSGATGKGAANALIDDINQDASKATNRASDFLKQDYSGPSATSYTAGLGDKRKAINDQLNVVDTEAAQSAALNKTYAAKDPNYTQGFGLLDQFLIQGTDSGRNALAKVKGKTANVNSAYDEAAGSLSAAEKSARDALAANKGRVTGAATDKYTNILKSGDDKVREMNAPTFGFGVDVDGYRDASLGDVLTAKDVADLEALASLSGNKTDASWYAKTYNAGTARPVAPPPPETYTAPGAPVASEDVVSSPTNSVNKAISDIEGAIPIPKPKVTAPRVSTPKLKYR